MRTRGTLEQFTQLRALFSASDAERRAYADTCDVDTLAALYAEASLMQTHIGELVLPLVDRAARVRWLDRGSEAFAVAYRALDTHIDGRPVPDLPYTLDGYRAEVDAERDALQQERAGFERERDQTVRYLKALIAALSDAFGEDLVNTILADAKAREVARLRDGILSETE